MPRRVVLLTVGTRGDVQPVISLGRGLKAAGYAVRLVAPTNFTSWIASHGLEVECFNIDFEVLLRDQEVLTIHWSGQCSSEGAIHDLLSATSDSAVQAAENRIRSDAYR